MVTVSAQAIHPQEGGGSGGGGTAGGGGGGEHSTMWKTLTAQGATLSGALSALQAKTDREVFLGQVALIVLGTALARQGTLRDLDTLVRSPEVAEIVPLVVAQGRATTLLQQGTSQQVAWRLRTFVTKPRANLAVLENPLWHFLAQSYGLGRASYAPLFAPAAGGGEGFRYLGTALFIAGRLRDTLPPQTSAALAWIIRRNDFGGVVAGGAEQQFHVAVRAVRAHWNLADPRSPLLTLAVTGDVTAARDETLVSQPRQMKALVARQMEAEVAALVRRLQADHADVLGLGERLRQRGALPRGPWPAAFARLRVRVRVRVRLEPGKVR